MIARYLRLGDEILRDGSLQKVIELRFTPATVTPGRPFGVVSGATACRTHGRCKHGFALPADEMLFVRRASHSSRPIAD